jgi:hypothetical protein
METLFIYLVKSSGLIGMFYLAYIILLRKETFFNSNRWFLLAGLITSVVLPLVVFTKIVWVDPSPTNFDWSKIPVTTVVENEAFEINRYLVFALVYLIGILGFLVKLVVDFYSVSKVLKGKTVQQQADYKFIDLKENVSPFSYFNFIVYNSSLYSETELENILEHEKVHSAQNHTIDVLISRLFCVVFWFNPLVWLYKKVIIQNLEFIADSEAFKNISDKKAYQLTLLKITTHNSCVAITNHFYQSLIKKRIVMLNKNQSNKRNYWKYALVLPLLGTFVFFFQVKVIAQEKALEPIAVEHSKANENSVDIYKINKNTSDVELKEKTNALKEKYGVTLTFSDVERNSENELTAIKVDLKKGKEIAKKMELKGTEAIKTFGIIVSKNEKGELTTDFSTDETMIDNSNSVLISPNAPIVSLKKPLIIIDGKRTNLTSDELNKLDSNSIQSMSVLKEIHAVEKYGKDGKNGVIEIITKENKNALKTAEGYAIVTAEFSENETYNHITAINNNKEINAKKALILFDGNEISYHDLDKIDVKTISSSGSTVASHAVKKYGDKGKNGVIFINTKNYDSEHFPYLKEMREKENNKSSKNADVNKTASTGTNYHSEKEKTDVFAIATINQSADNFDNKTISKQKPLIILNGKKTEATFDISIIDSNQIETINVLKGNAAKEKYGKDGEDGVIEIITKKNSDILKSTNK